MAKGPLCHFFSFSCPTPSLESWLCLTRLFSVTVLLLLLLFLLYKFFFLLYIIIIIIFIIMQYIIIIIIIIIINACKKKATSEFCSYSYCFWFICSCRVAKGSQLGQTLSNPKLFFSLV